MAAGFGSSRQSKCVLRKGCGHYGSAKCVACPIPDDSGRLMCPSCRSPLFFLDVTEDRGRWGCSNLPGKGCGATVSVPLPGSVTAEAAKQARQVRLDGETEAEERALNAGMNWLLQHQQPDGSWPVVPVLRVPAPDVHRPWQRKEWTESTIGLNVIVPDWRRLFTTATALQALLAAENLNSTTLKSGIVQK